MSRANAALILKNTGYIDSAQEVRFLCTEGVDHIFSHCDGRLLAVDNVLGRVVRVNGEAA